MQRVHPVGFSASCVTAALASLLVIGGCAAALPPDHAPWVATAQHGMVVTDSPHASLAGCDILEKGGNAIDAAAAASLALGVTRPFSSGLGGGGFLMLRLGRSGEVFILDYREKAPAASEPDMFVKAAQGAKTPPPSQFGGLAVAVPGLIAGHATLLERFGTRTLAEVAQPAALLAENGFAVDQSYVDAVSAVLRRLREHPELGGMTASLRRGLLFEGQELRPGTVLRQPEMAATLRALASGGRNAFYHGEIGRAIVRTVQKAGGIMTLGDLAAYQPVWRQPIRARYRGYEVLLMPPPSSGGICLAETLNILEHWDLPGIQKEDPGLAAHLTVEALKHAFADRARHLGDADFVDVPVQKLVSREYAAELAARIREDRTQRPASYGLPLPDDAGTTHFCIADRWGNVVSVTETINTSFGSLLVAESTGIVLNNEMDDFTAQPGVRNAFRLRQSSRNAVEPGKRPLSSMSPLIVLSGGRPVLALGGSGGPRIITASLQVMLNVLDYGLPLESAVSRPRFHHQWDPDVVFRNNLPETDPVLQGLRRRGHLISDEPRGGIVQALQLSESGMIGASDPRKGGRPAGF